MTDLRLEFNEGILLQTTDVGRYDGDNELEIYEFYLTNKNLICVYDKSTGIFSKEEMVIDKIPLNTIRVVNGVVQIQKVNDDDYGDCLQLLYTNGKRELFELNVSPKKEYPKWQNAITEAVLLCVDASCDKKTVFVEPKNEVSSVAETIKVEVEPIVEEKKYIYCSNCGEKLIAGSRFCNACGTPTEKLEPEKVESAPIQDEKIIATPSITPPSVKQEKKDEESLKTEPKQSTYSERKQEFAGKIIKCPSCGAELQSFTAVCPDCGHEINSQNVSSSLKEFIDSINEYDKVIANDPEPPKTGWKTWSKGKKVLWVILNIVTSFVPLVVYLVFPLIKPFLLPKSVPALSADEKRKAALIENYTFPNEREATIEAMMFTKSKMAFLASEKFNKKTLYWTNLWNTKAEQLNQKASIILKGDKIVESTYADIAASKNKVDKSVKVRAIIGATIIVVFLAFVLINGSIFSGITNVFSGIGGTTQTSNDEDFEWLETGLSTKIPKIEAKKGRIQTNSDTELWISLDGVSYNEFEGYITSCKEMGYTVDAEKDTNTYTAYNSEGYLLEVSCYGENFSVELKAPLSGDPDFKWPDHELASMIPELSGKTGVVETKTEDTIKIVLYDITESEIKSYISSCENSGYTVDSEKKDTSFNGFNKDGYELNVSYNEMKAMTITVNAPMKFSKISWPSSGPADLIPKPSSDMGKISSDYDWTFSVYISGMTIDDFNAYVDKCLDKGFEKDYRYDTSFSANKGDDIDLTVQYKGFNTVYISITNYDEF